MFDHDRPEIPQDYEWYEKFINEDGAVFGVFVSAVGGGTIGRAYSANHWHYRIIEQESMNTVMEGSDLYCPFATTHHMAAEAAWEFFEYR
jgi:hypothetical protein